MLIMKIPILHSLLKRDKRTSAGFVVAIGGKGVHFAQLKYVAGRPHVVSYVFNQVENNKKFC